jgi:hypothetical protein
MKIKKDGPIKFRWELVVILGILLCGILLTIFAGFFPFPRGAGRILRPLVLAIQLAMLVTLLLMFSRALKWLEGIDKSAETLDHLVGATEKIRTILTQISQNTRLSETAKTIAYRDVDRQSLREAVFDKLQQQDFETTFKIIDEIGQSTVYQELARQLRSEANRFRDATDAERINQVIAHIEKLFEGYQWAKASILTERLIKTYPKSEQAKGLRQQLAEQKRLRKQALLGTWDEAVKRQETDQSIEILKELDQYLTPSEGLALQEAARDVFKNKLHGLGVKFSLAVSERRWSDALETGVEIVRDFPNSRMAQEIREKIDVLQQKVEQPT